MTSLKLPKDSFFEALEKNNELLNFGKPSRDIALKYIQQSRSVIDIGAHIGISVLHWATMFDNVYAFEPMKEHFDCLEYNTESFSNIKCFNFALSNETSIKNAAYRTTKNSGSFQLLDDSYQQPSKKLQEKFFKLKLKS